MTLSEKVRAFRRLSYLLEEQSKVVSSMGTNEDAPVYNIEWGHDLLTKYNCYNTEINKLKKDLGLW